MVPAAERSVSLSGATAIGIGGMVGGGIFAVLGIAATEAGGATPIAFLIAGVVAALTAFSYSRLSVRYQSVGGTVAIIDAVFGRSAVTGSLNVILWVGYIATTALYASAFGNYAATLFPGGTDPNPVFLRFLILLGVMVPWLINLADAGLISRTEGVVVGIKLAILLLVIAAGFPSVSTERLAPSTWPSLLGVIAAGMLIFVAYEGFELISNASAEVRRPRRNLPLAFGLSVGLVIVLYVLISIVVVGSLTPDQIASSSDFALAKAAQTSLGQAGFVLVSISAVLATFSAINATLYGSARLSFTIATERELPERFETLTWNQPIGLHVTAGFGAAAAIGLQLGGISAMSSAIFLFVFAAVNAAGFRQADTAWVRGLTGAGVVGCLGSLAILLGQTALNDPVALVALVGMVAAALLLERRFLARQGA